MGIDKPARNPLAVAVASRFLRKKKQKKKTIGSIKPDDPTSVESASSTSGNDYEVFLSFRGRDTRTGFTDHLYNSLVDAGVSVFRDDDELRIGEKIGPDLLRAIKSSKISIPILSPGYASSKWCLRELAQMIVCKRSEGHRVLPVFYKVEPGQVKDQSGSFGEGFRSLKNRHEADVVQQWERALQEVGRLKGWESEKIANGHEAELVKKIVREVLDMNRGSPIMNVQSICANDGQMRKLKRKVEELDTKEADIKELMETESAASSVRKKPRILVEKWLKDTERARNNFQTIGQANGETLPPKEQVETLTREVEELIDKTLPQTLLTESRDAKGDPFFERKLMGEAIHGKIELIWRRLEKDNHECKLGICGMGGVGKTTIMMHVHNRLLRAETVDGVLFITVSQDFSIYKLQYDIWRALKLGVLEEEHVMKRAALLSKRLKRKKNCVLILDDVWQHFELQDVGIPVGAGVKVVLTTRSSEVCSRMDCEEIKIQPLGEEEAWKLFVEELGSKPLANLLVEKVARKIANRCTGLPLAIKAMASSMRGVKNVFVWQDTVNKLERSLTKHTEMGNMVLPVLRLSYERLSNPQVKQCFLFCALFPEDKSIEQMQLIEYFIDEGFLDEVDTREEQYYRGLAVVDMLRNACLLEVTYKGVRMHDLIREMALDIMSTTCMVKAGLGLQRILNEKDWTEDLEKVSLMEGWIEDISPDMSPNCPKLSTLLLNGSLRSENVQIQDSFFMKLGGLKVLNLSGCAIKELPDSMSELANLKALLLRNCRSLHRIPYLGKLESLRKLDASGCVSLLAVEGLKELRNLRYLDLSKTGIERLLEGTFRRMVNLQYLRIAGKVKAEEVIQLKELERLKCNFCNIDDFNKYVRFMKRSGYHNYRLIVDPEKSLWLVTACIYSDPKILPENKKKDDDDDHYNYRKSVEMRSCHYAMAKVGDERNNDSILILGDVECFVWRYCGCMTNLSSIGLLRCLKVLKIIECDNLVVLCGGAGVDEEEVRSTRDSLAPLFPSLETLTIGGCSKLKYLFGHELKFSFPLLREVIIYECEGIEGMTTSVASPRQLGGPAFPRLESIYVSFCGNMKRVMESEWLPHFPNLRKIEVHNCDSIRELLPRECFLNLPNLKSIKVSLCKGIEEIISGGGENQGGSAPLHTSSSSLPSPISLPKLKTLSLSYLPQLKSIWEEGALNLIPGASVEVTEEEVNNPCDCPTPLFPSLEELTIERCSKLKYLFGHELRFSFPLLRYVTIGGCEGIEGMTTSVASPRQLGGPAFPRLESIEVYDCGNMKGVMESEWLPHFPNLREIRVEESDSIRELLPRECFLHLPNLESIHVRGCKGIEEIISGGGENQGGSAPLDTPSSSLPSPISPPKLKTLWLFDLPQLKSIWEEGAVNLIPGASVKVIHSPKLETIPPGLTLWTSGISETEDDSSGTNSLDAGHLPIILR